MKKRRKQCRQAEEVEEDIPKSDLKFSYKFDHQLVFVNICNTIIPETHEEAIHCEDSGK